MTTGLVFTVAANREEEQHSPPSTAKTAITWTANENRQLFINAKCNLTNYVREASTEYEARTRNRQLGTLLIGQPLFPLERLASPSACALRGARCSWQRPRDSMPKPLGSAKRWVPRRRCG